MKVALYLCKEIPKDIGGGYTFTSSIFNSLLNLVSNTSHNFVVYSYTKEVPQQLKITDQVTFVSLHGTFQERTSRPLIATKNAILKKLKNPIKQFKIEPWRPKYIIDSLATNNIDVTWSLDTSRITTEIPFITTVWDLQHRLQPYFPEVSTKGEWNKREDFIANTLRRASYIITGTERGKAEIESFYQVPSERIKILPFPTPQFALNHCPTDNKEIFKKYNIPENYLFYPAQFWSHKNHTNLLLAVKILKDKYNTEFAVVFSGSDKGNEEYVRQKVSELDLSKQVYFLGFVPQEDLISLYQNAFALTFVTFFGPDNLPPLEAFGLGCPVIASQVPGSQEQLGNAALLVNPKDPEHIAQAINSIWNDKNLREEFIHRGLERAANWTGDDYIKGVFSILDEFAAIRRCWK